MSAEEKEISGYFLDEKIVKEFKKEAKKQGKSYERAFEEAIKVWLEKKQEGSERQ